MHTAPPLSFGALLRHHRRAAGLTQDELAERAGLSLRAVSDLERGVKTRPHRDTVALLAAALQLQPPEQALLEATARPRPHPLTLGAAPVLDGSRQTLPVPLTPLIGREREVVAVRARLLAPQTHLLTLTGPGGTGKTRLALQVASTVLQDFPDGVVFVDLAPLRDPALVLPTIAQTLGVVEQAAEPLAATLTRRLRGTRTLLLLDNFEPVVAAAPQVGTLLAADAGLTVLVTSRVVLHIQGERAYPVPPLALPAPHHRPTLDALSHSEAIRLFIVRAQDVQPDFTLTEEIAPAVAEICTRLDGLPLAIELVAARLRVLPPRAMLARLGHRLTLAVGGARDLPARQQTLRDTIAWSYHLLAAAEQSLFARLAVFVGGATLGAVEAVCHRDEALDVLAGLESLVAQSLLRAEEGVEGEPRFRMLETIREYAWERLEAGGEAEALRLQHATYVLALAEAGEQALKGREQVAWLRRLEAEHDNLRAALGWAQASGAHELGLRLAGALGQFWWMRGYFSEGRRTVEGLLAQAGSGPAVVAGPVRAKALNAAAAIALSQGDLGQATTWCEESLGLAHAAGAPEESAPAVDGVGLAAATAVCGLGLVAAARGAYDQATAWYEESLVLLRDLGDRWGCAHIMANQAWVALVQGDAARAMALCHEGLALNREVGDRWGRSVLLWILGDVARVHGETRQARALLEESLALSQELGDNRNTATFLISLGAVALTQTEYARASALFRESLTLSRTMGNRENVADCLEGLAAAVWADEHTARAARWFGAAAVGRTALGTPRPPAEQAAYDERMAAVRAALGEEPFARAWAEGQALTLEQAVADALAHHDP